MGNTALLKFKHVGLMGSPPYTWGILNSVVVHEVIDRITPIYMGNTTGNCYVTLLGLGSPPYTWGIPGDTKKHSDTPRITPIYMGNTASSNVHRGQQWDHPHIHGEYKNLSTPLFRQLGSPPYTWGILLIGVPVPTCVRITPIYMGNTACFSSSLGSSMDHPHIHGEYSKSFSDR